MMAAITKGTPRMITNLQALEAILAEARAQGAADAEAEREEAKKKALKAMPSPEVLAIKKALGVPPVDRYAEEHDARLDKKKVEKLLSVSQGGGYYASAKIDELIAEIGIDRFLAAAPPDVAAKMRAQIKKERARKAKAAAPKPKPAAKIDGISAWAIRINGTQAQRDALAAQVAAEEAAQRQIRSPEGAAALASAIRRNTAAVNGNGKTMTSQAAIDRTWQEAHERVARETGRTR
jgi:hypothetical protein